MQKKDSLNYTPLQQTGRPDIRFFSIENSFQFQQSGKEGYKESQM